MATDLTSLANVRSFLQKPSADTAQDAIINSLVTRASKAIMDWTEREFVTTTVGSTARTFEYTGGGWLSLTPFDAQTVTLVRIDTDEASPTTLTTEEYRAYPRPNADGVYTALRLEPYLAHSRSRWQQRLVEVTGTWGFAAVPADVEHWCIVTVAIWLRRDVAGFSTSFNVEEDRVERPEMLPSAARNGLAVWKRQVYA